MRTSVNLRVIDLPKIVEASDKIGRGHSYLICKCLMKYFKSHPERIKLSQIRRLVEYQPDGVGYEIVDVDLDIDVYNLGVNFRAFSRISVSKMVTIALRIYLDEVVNEIIRGKGVKRNYVSYVHTMRHISDKNSLRWRIEWDVPKTGPQKHKKT